MGNTNTNSNSSNSDFSENFINSNSKQSTNQQILNQFAGNQNDFFDLSFLDSDEEYEQDGGLFDILDSSSDYNEQTGGNKYDTTESYSTDNFINKLKSKLNKNNNQFKDNSDTSPFITNQQGGNLNNYSDTSDFSDDNIKLMKGGYDSELDTIVNVAKEYLNQNGGVRSYDDEDDEDDEEDEDDDLDDSDDEDDIESSSISSADKKKIKPNRSVEKKVKPSRSNVLTKQIKSVSSESVSEDSDSDSYGSSSESFTNYLPEDSIDTSSINLVSFENPTNLKKPKSKSKSKLNSRSSSVY